MSGCGRAKLATVKMTESLDDPSLDRDDNDTEEYALRLQEHL